MEERRRAERRRSWFLVRLVSAEKGEWLAMSRNVSQTGALLATAKRLIVGQDVTLQFKLTPEDERPRELQGTIVRVDPNTEDPSGMWPHQIAVEFDDHLAGVDDLLQKDADAWSDDFLLDMEREGDEAKSKP